MELTLLIAATVEGGQRLHGVGYFWAPLGECGEVKSRATMQIMRQALLLWGCSLWRHQNLDVRTQSRKARGQQGEQTGAVRAKVHEGNIHCNCQPARRKWGMGMGLIMGASEIHCSQISRKQATALTAGSG